MKSNMLLPVALAALTTGAGLFTLARQAEAQDRAQAAHSGDVRSFRLEFLPDGSSLRLHAGAIPVQQRSQGGNGGGSMDESMRQFLRELREVQRRGGQEQGQGQDRGLGQGNSFDDLLKEFRRGFEDGAQVDEDAPPAPRGRGGNNNNNNGGGRLNPQDLLEEMMRRMGGAQGGDGRLGFGPMSEKDSPRTSKHHLSALAEWRPLVAQARQSTVRVIRKDRQIALATIVTADGYALTKASEVAKGDFECEFNDGRIVAAKVVNQLDAYDLALIKLEASGLTPAKFTDTVTPVGTLIAAVSTEEDPTGLGVISVAARSLDERSKGYLGVMMDKDIPEKGVRIMEAMPGGAAKRAGMEPGDIILALDGQEIQNPRHLQKLVAGLKPEQKVSVTIERDHKPKTLELSLGHRSEELLTRQLDQTALMGSNLSRNSSGYPNAVQSDLALQAQDAGGPVVDVDGNIVGLNIARAERVSTYLIPGKVINELLTDVQSGKFALSKDADTLHAELNEQNAKLQKAKDEMQQMEAERAATLKSLERFKK